MLFSEDAWPGLADGSITLTFRRWKRPQAKTGGRSLTPIGVLAIDDVSVVPVDGISDAEARAAGYDSRDQLIERLGRGGEVYRVAFHLDGPDPRIALRSATELTAEDVDELERRLSRYDGAASHGPWTRVVLGLIGERPGVPAADLAASLGRERLSFKADVRKLKALGLTESLEVGYRLSPRGRAFLERSP